MNYNQHLKTILLSVSLLLPPFICSADPSQTPSEKPAKVSNKHDKNQRSDHKAIAKSEQLTNTAVPKINIGIDFGAARKLAEQYALTGQKSLPKGIRKKLARGQPLPPGIAKKLSNQSMLAQLPVHQGYQWQMIGSDLILVDNNTQLIVDLLLDVFL